MQPFIDVCIKNNKGIFILVKTSNSSSGEIQNIINDEGISVSRALAHYVSKQSEKFLGKYNYSPIGAVVGATYPKEAKELRKIMSKSYFLVPGFGAQGGDCDDIVAMFNDDGLGAIVNSSRGILYSHMTDEERKNCTKADYLKSVEVATRKMQEEIYCTLKKNCSSIIY